VVGRTVGHYEILGGLGQGGMGAVYKARDVRLKRLVALKILPPEATANPGRVRRFVAEARAASGLSHPGIVTVFDVGDEQGVHFIAMELVSGRTLSRSSMEGRFAWPTHCATRWRSRTPWRAPTPRGSFTGTSSPET